KIARPRTAGGRVDRCDIGSKYQPEQDGITHQEHPETEHRALCSIVCVGVRAPEVDAGIFELLQLHDGVPLAMGSASPLLAGRLSSSRDTALTSCTFPSHRECFRRTSSAGIVR